MAQSEPPARLPMLCVNVEHCSIWSTRERTSQQEAKLTVHTVELEQAKPVHKSFRLTKPGSAVALQSQVRPALVLPEREGRALLAAAQAHDVSSSGVYSAGPAG